MSLLLALTGAVGGTVNGVVSGADSASALQAVGGVQSHIGAADSASSITTASAPAGAQSYIGIVGASTSAAALSSPAGQQSYIGSVDFSASPTAVQSVIGTLAAVQTQVGGASRVPRRRQAQQGRGFGFTHDPPQPTDEDLLQQALVARAAMNTRFLTLHLLTH